MPKRKNSRNASGSGSVRQRKDGKWEGRYSNGVSPGTGKPIRKSVYGATQREVVDKLTAIKAGIDAGTFIEPSKLTVSMWLNIWVAEYLGEVKQRTAQEYKGTCRLYLKHEVGASKLSALSAHMIQTMYNRLHKGVGEKSGLSPKTIKNINGVLHKALQQAVEIGYLRFNPSEAVKLPRVEKKEIKPLDDEQITAFLTAIQGHKWEAIYRVATFCGLRQGEVLGLAWSSVDFDRGTTLIDRQLQTINGKYKIVPPKNDKSRRITPAPSVMAILRSWRRRQMEWRLMAGSTWKNSGLVFTNSIGDNLSISTVYKDYKRLVASIGIPEARFHDLRHTYAVASLQSGDDIKTVQENLGHHTSSFTLDVYGHVSERMKLDSAARMESFIKSVEKGG